MWFPSGSSVFDATRRASRRSRPAQPTFRPDREAPPMAQKCSVDAEVPSSSFARLRAPLCASRAALIPSRRDDLRSPETRSGPPDDISGARGTREGRSAAVKKRPPEVGRVQGVAYARLVVISMLPPMLRATGQCSVWKPCTRSTTLRSCRGRRLAGRRQRCVSGRGYGPRTRPPRLPWSGDDRLQRGYRALPAHHRKVPASQAAAAATL